MSHYNYLKIDFYGQFNADTIHKLTYPEPYNVMDSAALLWLNPVTDPRAIRTLFPIAKHGYKVHRDVNGTYFSLLTRYDRDARQGYVAITVMIGAQYESIVNGKAIFELLNLLKTNVLDTNRFTVEAVEQCLIASSMPVVNAEPLRITPVQALSQQAFRVYSTDEELYDIFQFPQQKEYDLYGEVFLINKMWCNNTVPGVPLLTSPISRAYSMQSPANAATNTGNSQHKAYISKLGVPVITFLLGAALATGVTYYFMRNNGPGDDGVKIKPATEVIDNATIAKKTLRNNSSVEARPDTDTVALKHTSQDSIKHHQ